MTTQSLTGQPRNQVSALGPVKAELADLSPAVQAYIASLEAKAAATPAKSISFKVTAKKEDGTGTDGAISAYGLGRFPVTLYRGQWERLIEAVPALQAFIEANAAILSVKS